MTKEEIQKNSEHWYNKYKDAEKQIAELEQKLEQTEKDLADYQFNYPTIKELEKENRQLKSELAKKADTNHSLVEQIAELEEQLRIATDYPEWSKVVKLSEEQCFEEVVKIKDKLTKAKDLLNRFLRLHYNPIDDEHTLFCKVEQFLKEVE